MKFPILVSACLVGLNTRFDAKNKKIDGLVGVLKGKSFVPVCAEQLGGLTTPRAPAYIENGSGEDVIEGKAHSIKEAYVRFTGDTRVTGLIKECRGRGKARITESLTTSDWAEALGDTLRRKLIKEYKVSGLDDWRKIVSDIVPLPDFRSQHWIRLGGYGELPSVSQGATYRELTSPTDEEVTLSVSKYGGLESVTIEMIKNDDIMAIRQIPKRLARAAAQALYNAIFDDIFKDNATIYDNKALFHSSHSNLGSSALSASSYMATRKAMAQQTAYGNSEEYLNLYPKYLIVPVDLEDTAFKLCHSPVYVNPFQSPSGSYH